jgi:antitoxin YefM
MVVSMAEWESRQETLAVLSDPQAVADLRDAEESRAAGEIYSTDEVLAELAARRRPALWSRLSWVSVWMR